MFQGNFKMALGSLKSTKWRSLLTMLGIIIGVVSVVTTISIGEGVKQQILSQINHSGPDLITIRPGRTFKQDERGKISGINYINAISPTTFNEHDFRIVEKTDGLRVVVPLSLVNGVPQVDDHTYEDGFIIATGQGLPDILNQKMEYGTFFSDNDAYKTGAVIGKKVAIQMFKENAPIGRSFTIRGQTFVVRGVLDDFPSSPITLNSDYNSAIFIPFDAGKQLNGDSAQIYELLARPIKSSQVDAEVKKIESNLIAAHAGQKDFTVLRQKENLAIANNILTILTAFIGSIAAVSLLVGGIGIMNIMLVSVSERTHEIGIRKAIGATNRQILFQFLIEATVLSLVGGLIGIVLSLFANYGLRLTTSLRPIITVPIIALASGSAIVVGIIFGLAPALKAARKDPIIALRHE
ncbi:MAG: ABC transporter permease [Candidatus Saccharimonadales bacterium]